MTTKDEPFLGNILVDTVNKQFQTQRFNVEFAFLKDTTVNTVLEDLEEALSEMGLQMVIPRNQCALAYDSSQHHYSNNNNNNVNMNSGVQENRDGDNFRRLSRGRDAAGVIENNNDDNNMKNGNDYPTILTGMDCIFKAPEVEAFYDLNRRCGLSRSATFIVVRKTERRRSSTSPSSQPREIQNSARYDHQTTTTTTGKTTTGRTAGSEVGLSVYLLPRQHQFDDSANLLLATSPQGTSEQDETDSKYQAALATVREMVSAEEKGIMNARRQQHNPQREPHWSLQLNKPPSREEWLQAVEAEAAAYDRLAAHFTHATSAAAVQQEELRNLLKNEVNELHERVDAVKIHVTKRQALQERVDQLKLEVEAQREKEGELLRALEKMKYSEMRSQQQQYQQPPPPVVPPTSHAFIFHQNERSASQHGSPLPNDFGTNTSTIHASTAGMEAAGGSNFLSPSLREEVRRALSPQRPTPVSEQHQHQQQQQQQKSALQQLRLLAAELSHHLRSPNPNPGERHRLMAAIRTLRQQVELQQVESFQEIRESPVRSSANRRII
ncbi:uncharacterized protein TM35_000201430 [Trypanosoma theileri]|uniref:Uncharacterized protein n=1 Tax=Trypanosoma theileri TaxID=67003 RepID=A0A1X0NSQ9_9TRYP|nr:uncharacterized protein TM35_000201430 [Trypanosoma theileri]ORC87734.1 hypothetical protein TM35_000201430 [Trypanosoma theileri]